MFWNSKDSLSIKIEKLSGEVLADIGEYLFGVTASRKSYDEFIKITSTIVSSKPARQKKEIRERRKEWKKKNILFPQYSHMTGFFYNGSKIDGYITAYWVVTLYWDKKILDKEKLIKQSIKKEEKVIRWDEYLGNFKFSDLKFFYTINNENCKGTVWFSIYQYSQFNDFGDSYKHKSKVREIFKFITSDEKSFYPLTDQKNKELESKNKEEEERRLIEENKEKKRIEKARIKKQKILQDKIKTKEKKESILSKLDTDSDGILDIVQSEDFLAVLKKYESKIMEIDRTYIKNFVKLSNFLNSKKNSLQQTFEILVKVEFSKDLEPLSQILNNKIHSYNSILFHSLSMLVSLVRNEMITFYQIYEVFDEMNVFDSKFEKDMLGGIKNINSNLGLVNQNLNKIEKGIVEFREQFYELMNQMKESDQRIIDSIDNLTYTTSSSIQSLNNNVQNELNSINSSIKFNNLLTGIQTYQMYKVNLNTKSLKG